MSEISEINMPTVIHVLGVSGISGKKTMAYLFRIFRTFSSSFICAHAPEVPHSFRSFARAPGLFFFRMFRIAFGIIISVICLGTRAAFFRIFRTLPAHVSHLAYLFQIFRTFSSSFICAHAPKVPHFFRTFTRAPGMFFFRIFRTLPGHIYFGYLGHSAAHLFAHIPLVLRKLCIFFRTFT